MLTFPREEYLARIEKTKQRMQKEGIDCLLISQQANMNYLTGYDGWSFYVHQCVIVSLEQEQPIWIGRGMDANGARILSFLDKENIYEYPDYLVHNTVDHPMHHIAKIIHEKGWDKKTFGVEMDQFYFTHRAYLELEAKLPNAKFVDGNALVNWVRVIKSDREIEFMKIAGQIAENVMQTAVDSINVGVRECDAAAEIARSQYRGTAEHSGDYPAIVPLMMAGEKTKTPHLTWTEKKFAADEAVLLELSGVYRHYHTPIARTIFLGQNPPPIMTETAAVVTEGLAAALEIIKPGVVAEDVEARWREAIAHSSIVKESRLGYSIGINYPPDWGEHTISLRPGDKTVIQPGMALHLIPGIWYDNVGFEIDASIVVTETGYEHLFNYPVDLVLK
ncbi:M24 family metallopeptidase [uncultured Desulfuromusa sp.]|uniref:M24 family metallopeptidase n=1 Tax=uncultured Desulfuromusa sp. TaxID=219183 RepID=UPI002AA82F40|nr:M24 family metallopeptidase [uncultured Desulfuromusa sp.]